MNAGKGVVAVSAAIIVGVLALQHLTPSEGEPAPRSQVSADQSVAPVSGPVEFAVQMLPVGESFTRRMRLDVQSRVPHPQMNVQQLEFTLECETQTEVAARTERGEMVLEERVVDLEVTRALGDGEEIPPEALEATTIPGLTLVEEIRGTVIRRVVDERGRALDIDVTNAASVRGEALIQEMLFAALSGLPDGPAEAGTTWTETVTLPGVNTPILITNTVDRIEERAGRQVGVIKREADVAITESLPLPAYLGIPTYVLGSLGGLQGRLSGESVVVVKTGESLRETMVADLQVPVRVQIPGGVMTVPTEMRQEFLFEAQPQP